MKALTGLALLFSLLFTFSCSEQDNIDFPFIDEPRLTLNQDNIKIDMGFENIEIDGVVTLPIPEYENSFISFSPSNTVGTRMQITLSLGDVLNSDLQLLPPQSLPDGRPLPGVASGSLPSIAFQVPALGGMTFYLGKEFFGFFAPYDTTIDNENIITARYFSNGTRLGNISVVGGTDMDSRGMLLLIQLNNVVKSRLKAIHRQYN